MTTYTNVGKPGNMAQSLLLYSKRLFLQKNNFPFYRYHPSDEDIIPIPGVCIFCIFLQNCRNPQSRSEPSPMNKLNKSARFEGQMPQQGISLSFLRSLRNFEDPDFSLEISQDVCYKPIDEITRFEYSCDNDKYFSFRSGKHRPVKSYKDIECHHCGAVLPMEISNMSTSEKNVWYPGKKCSICGSQEFYPLIKPSEPVQTVPVSGWRYNPWYGIIAVSIVIILIPTWLFLSRKKNKPAPKNMMLICTECNETFEAKVEGNPPYPCSICDKKAAYIVLYCLDDYTLYPKKTLKGVESGFPPCPECGKIRPGLISDRAKLDEIRTERQHYEEWKKQQEGKQDEDRE